jgi:hypothetical protein
MQDSKGNNEIFGSLSEVKLNELRKMIIGLDTEDLKRLSLLINDPEAFSEEISDLLPNSIKIMLEKGKVSYNELVPVIETALKDSIEQNPHTLSDILFPVMLPAIRKAVADDIRNMINSLNTTLENGFSPKRIRWRFKALFSGISYAEIVLSHAYVYRVKQVLLIHKQTGLLLNSASDNDDSVTKNDDMVSSMLSAIKDFVQDSFSVDGENELDTIKVGKFNIWIEQGPGAILAAIVDGDAPSGLRTLLKESIEKIHLKLAYALENFDGEISIFEKANPYLQSCILSEQKERKKKKPVVLIFILLLFVGFGSYQAYLSIEKYIKFNKFEDALSAYPGIVITDNNDSGGKKIYEGLRDPLSIKPTTISSNYNIDTSQIGFDLKPYISLDDEIILQRAYLKLSPPSKAILKYRDGTLYVSGEANEDWVYAMKLKYSGIPGINKVDFSKINALTSRKEVSRTCLSIEQYFFVFKYNIVELNEQQETKFSSLINEVNTVLDFNFSQDSVPVIIVIAHTSYEGNAEGNEKIAFDRAQQFINLMINAGIPMEVLVPKTDYIEDINEAFPVRSVSFRVIYSKPEDL